MPRKIDIGLPLYLMTGFAGAAALCVAAASRDVTGNQNPDEGDPTPPVVIFSTLLPDIPGKRLVVVDLKFASKSSKETSAHRHPGSVYVYMTQGTARLGIEGQPVQQVRKGESFFEPAGALHTVAESASTTEPASGIAVMIVPDGAPLVL